jgi:hypothetical protein
VTNLAARFSPVPHNQQKKKKNLINIVTGSDIQTDSALAAVPCPCILASSFPDENRQGDYLDRF